MELQELFLRHPWVYLVHFLCWVGCFFFSCRFTYQSLKEFKRQSYNFYITDIWAAIVCLLPFFLVIKQGVDDKTPVTFDIAYWFCITLLSVCFGMCLGLAYSWPTGGQVLPGRLQQACWIFWGALVGMLGLISASALFIYLLLMLSCPPALVLTGVLIFVLFRRKPSNF